MAETLMTSVLVVRMPSSLVKCAKGLAEAGGRSLEAEIRRAVREYVAVEVS